MNLKFLRASFGWMLLMAASFSVVAQQPVENKPIASQVAALRNGGMNFKAVNPFTVNISRKAEAASAVTDATPVTIDMGKVKELLASKSDAIEFNFPYENKNLTAELYRVNIFTDDFKVVTDQSNGDGVLYTPGVYYRGIVKGDDHSLAAFSFFDGEMMAIVSTDEYGNINIGKSLATGAKASDYIIYSDKNFINRPLTNCATVDDPAYAEKLKEYAQSGGTLRTNHCVRFYYEVDHNIYTSSGSTVTGTTNWMTAVHNNIATLYSNDQVNTAISEIFVWTGTDPYTGTTSSSQLSKFKANRPTFNGDVGELVGIDQNSSLGGVASTINGMCSSTNKYCYADVYYSYSTVPTYSWTVEVCTHEFGHLLGSYHTHNCGWPNGAIDNCYTTEGGCPKGPAPVNGGTIMSYCHLTSYGINFNNGFGPLPAAAIQGAVDAASCLTSSCIPSCNATSGLSASNISTTSATLNWTTVSGASSYNIQYRPTGSSTWSNTTSTTNSKSVTGLALNTQYEFQVQTVCSFGLSSYTASATFTTLTAACSDPYEPNNAKNKAVAISLNTNVSALISSSTDKDWFSFANSSTAKNIKVTLSNLPDDYDLELYNPNGTKVSTSENANTESEEILYNTATVGTYKVRVLGYGGVFSTTQCYLLLATTSSTPFKTAAAEITAASMNVFPNPSAGNITVQYNSTTDASVNMLVFDVTGKVMHTEIKTVNAGANTFNLNLQSFSGGIYFMEIINGIDVTRSKFIIER